MVNWREDGDMSKLPYCVRAGGKILMFLTGRDFFVVTETRSSSNTYMIIKKQVAAL